MNNKTLGIIAIVFGGLVLYSQQEYAWVVSAISIGVGSGIFLFVKYSDGSAEEKSPPLGLKLQYLLHNLPEFYLLSVFAMIMSCIVP